jgi:hypothetical protein
MVEEKASSQGNLSSIEYWMEKRDMPESLLHFPSDQ